MASGNDQDVVFDFDGALNLARRLWSFADELEAAATDRATGAETALTSWLGAYADEFVERMNTEQTNLAQVVAGLRTEADQWAQAWKDATDEQNRRLWARQVDDMKADRNLWDRGVDFFTGFDYPPDPVPVRKPTPSGFYATC